MRLAISNIAWPAGADATVAPLMRKYGVEGVELALTKVWPEPFEVSSADLRTYRDWWEKRGLRVAALQALLFGKPQLTVFADEQTRRHTLDYLAKMIDRAGQLGARALVFGSPRNRRREGLSHAEAWVLAVPFFRELGGIARRHGVCFCIEPNPPAYGCDFITTVAEAIELVDTVADGGFGLHLDTAAMSLVGDPPGQSIIAAGERLSHFHVSAPYLEEVGDGAVPHAEFTSALRQRDYHGWVSIEMAEPKQGGTWEERVERSLSFVREVYKPGAPATGHAAPVAGAPGL